MAVLICGSWRLTPSLTFEGRFSEQILPDQLHILNVSFLVPALRRDFGGCGQHRLQPAVAGDALPMAMLGSDGAEYLERLSGLGISTRCVGQVGDTYTAQAMITTDRDNNQITAFHPGAMMQAHANRIDGSLPDVRIGIVAPDGRDAMMEHAAQFQAAGIPFVFDPGQGLPMFSGEELLRFVEQASWVAVNDYEGKMLCERTGLDLAALSRKVQGLVVTWERRVRSLGGWCPDRSVAGGAHPDRRSHGLRRCMAWRPALWAGAGLVPGALRCTGQSPGALKIAVRGPQNYTLDFDPASLGT